MSAERSHLQYNTGHILGVKYSSHPQHSPDVDDPMRICKQKHARGHNPWGSYSMQTTYMVGVANMRVRHVEQFCGLTLCVLRIALCVTISSW